MKNIAIIGSGSWGVALGMHLARMGNNVRIWSFEKEEADLINNEKKCKFLPNAVIPDGVECKTEYKEVIEGAELIVQVTPSKFTRDTVKQYNDVKTSGEATVNLNELAEKLITNPVIQKVEVLEGDHMIHLTNAQSIINSIKNFKI